MQVIENEVKIRSGSLRRSGKRGLCFKYPTDVADQLGFGPGHRFEQFVTAKGEMLIRPILSEKAVVV